MPEFPLGIDRTMHQSTLIGSAVQRTLWDENLERVVAEWIGMEDFVAPNKVRDTDPGMRNLPFYDVMKRMTLRQVRSKLSWLDTDELKLVKLDEPDGKSVGDTTDRGNDSASTTLDSPRLLIEHYFKWSTPKRPKKDPKLDGTERPAYAVIDVEQKKLLYICLREEDDPRDAERFNEAQQAFAESQQAQSSAMENHGRAIEAFNMGQIPSAPEAPDLPKLTEPTQRQREVPMCTHFCAYPSDGFYGHGLGDFLTGMTKASNTIINQSLDAMTMRIARGGYVSNLVKGPRGIQPTSPGKLTGVDVPPEQLKNAIWYPDMPPGDPFVQYLIGFIQQSAQGIVGSFDTMSGDMPKSNQSAQGTMALIEEMRAPITVMAKRAKIALTEEYSQIWRLLGQWLPDQKAMDIIGEDGTVQNVQVGRRLFSPNSRIYPTADSRTKSERMSDATAQFGFATQNPLVQMAMQQGNPLALQLLGDLSANVFRSFGNDKAALMIAQLAVPPSPPPGMPAAGGPPPGPPQPQPSPPNGAPPS
jgi:hypothetical protein